MGRDTSTEQLNLPTTSSLLYETDTRQIRQSLSVKKKTSALQNDNQVVIDEMLCKFFAKTGLPSDTVRDPSFIQLIYILNKDYSPPTPSTVDYELEAITNKMILDKRSIDLIKVDQPISVTVDIIKKSYDVFLAFSLHYINIDGHRKNVVHLRKMKTAEIDPKLILEEISLAYNKHVAKEFRVPSIVTSREIAQYFVKSKSIERSYLCYYSQITTFANSILSIPELLFALDALKKFYLGVKMGYEVQHRIEKYFLSKKVIFELPDIELSNWTDVSEFLSHVLQYHRLMVDCSLSFLAIHPRYIADNLYEQLMYLQTILSHLNKSVKELSKSDSFASQVLPEIIQIRRLFITTDLDTMISVQVKRKFVEHFGSLVECDYKTDFYKAATFLDPRYSYDYELFDDNVWGTFVDYTKNSILYSDFEPDLPRFEKKHRVSLEIIKFRRLLESRRPSLKPFSWWKIHSKEFPFLFNAAKTFISPPPCAIDSEQYFGSCGKFVMNNKKMSLKQFNNTLAVASSLETFRGRGWTEKHITLEPIAIDRGSAVNWAKSVQIPVIRKKKTATPEAEAVEKFSNFVESTSANKNQPVDAVKKEPIDPNEPVFDLSTYYMQAPDMKKENIATGTSYETSNPEMKPESLLLENMKVGSDSGGSIPKVKVESDEMSAPSPSTSTMTPKLTYVSTKTDNEKLSEVESKKISTRPVDRRVFIRVPYQRTAMERVLQSTSAESSTFTSIDYVSARLARSNSLKRPADTKILQPPYILESGRKKICTNIETDTGVVIKKRLFPRSTPSNLESVTMKMATPQNIRFDSVPKTTTTSTSNDQIKERPSTSEEFHVKEEEL